mmetsp:Transcript_7843/g.14607  ORF Transcript_7843/g.14607 Transcript_7843/m.14607 type:complete len:346 (+) Transcript_7843:130-1167(+)
MFASVSLMSATLMTSPLVIVAVAMWAMELHRKEMTTPGAAVLNATFKAVFQWFRAEILGLAACAMLVVFLCIRQRHIGFESIPDSDSQVWQQITDEWPMLMTADSLLAIQSMLRVVMLLSALLRGGAHAGASALVPESASFMLLASICRIGLIALSPFDVYHLDGPLGGAFYVIFEVAAFALLILLSHGIIHQGVRGIGMLAGGLFVSFMAAGRHQFHLADDAHLDSLFSMALILELPAAASLLLRTCAAAIPANESSPKHSYMGFTHLALPIQQGLSLYFLLGGLARWLETPEALMRVGRPFEFMWAVGAAQVVIYLFAALVYLISSMEESEVEPHSEGFLVEV